MTDSTAKPTIEQILTQAADPAYVRTTTARILLRQDLLAEHDRLEAELTAAVQADAAENRLPEAPAISQQILDLEAEIDAAKIEFRFRSIGHRAWADLMAAHPPTKEQLKVLGRIDHNPLTFPSAAIAASCIDPAMTDDDVTQLERLLNDTQFNLLFVRCVEANTGGMDTPKSAAAGVIHRVNGRSANTPAPAASPAQSSLAES
jgi:hypothetical protein